MSNKFSIISSNILTAIVILAISYFVFSDGSQSKLFSNSASTTPIVNIEPTLTPTNIAQTNTNTKTFVFDNFHGSSNVSLKFQFEYPETWINDGQYFSPEKIKYYDLYSVKAPFYFDLIMTDIFKDTEFYYQVSISKKKSPNSHVKIDGVDFERYDLIDYGSYGGESAGRVIVYVGPKIKIDGVEYYLVFHWEEKPLTTTIAKNDPEIFEAVVKSLKFK